PLDARRFDLEPEAAALAGAARDRDLAPHQAHELAADGQPEPGASEPAVRIARLFEGLEDELELLRIDPDAGIGDLETQPAGSGSGVPHIDAQRDRSPIGKSHRVAEQVDEHLAQPPLVHESPSGPGLGLLDRAAEALQLRL